LEHLWEALEESKTPRPSPVSPTFPPTKLESFNKLKEEAKSMIGGARKCKEIWAAIRKADFRKEGLLNEANIKLVFEKCQQHIFELLRVQTPTEFIDVFDYGGDGLLNEDEQILLFSIIKEKM
jgi:hypothetical protein